MEKSEKKTSYFSKGVKDGLPIGLGYLSVSFAFGVQASILGVPILISLLISATNLTSAGQLAGLEVIARNGGFLEIILTQVVINARYFLMSITLSQKLEDNYSLPHRMLSSAFITDEIFLVSVTRQKSVYKKYFYGLSLLPYIFWTLGTLFGAVLGGILPSDIQGALGIAIYAMFIAIIIPPAKENRGILFAVLISGAISCLFYYIPLLRDTISQGFAIIISAVISALILAKIFPRGGADE